jgi:hypothetical protein
MGVAVPLMAAEPGLGLARIARPNDDPTSVAVPAAIVSRAGAPVPE